MELEPLADFGGGCLILRGDLYGSGWQCGDGEREVVCGMLGDCEGHRVDVCVV